MKRTEEISRYAVGVGLKVRDEAIIGGLDCYTAETLSALAQSSVIKGAEWADKNPPNGLREKWYKIPKDKNGFFDDDSDLYEQLPIILAEIYDGGLSINLYYIDEENWHDTLADLSRSRFKYYIKVEELTEDGK